jgi:hypothetical protein
MAEKLGDVNVELFALSYGSLVRAIVKETNNIEEANVKLGKIGVSMGTRITDDIVVHLKGNCNFKNARELVDKLIIDGFRKYLGVTATVVGNAEPAITIRLQDCPVTRYVTIPRECEGLVYLQPLISAIKTICEKLHYSTEVRLTSDSLKPGTDLSKGPPATDIEIKLLGVMRDSLPPGEYRD